MRTKHNSNRIRILRRRRLALALVSAMAMPMAMAQNLPSAGTVVPGSGSATISQTATEMTITQTTKGAIIDWYNFDIGTGYGVTFDQQFGNSSVTLNRVLGSGMAQSVIDGTLTANGNVFIINPSGVLFGSGAQVNVGGLVASSLWLSDAAFGNGLATGQYVFSGFNGSISPTHQVRNNGTITAGAGGVGLVGPSLWNRGAITANGGHIGLAAGTTVTMDFVGDGLTQVTINVPPTEDSVIIQDRFGSMTADGGNIMLRTAATAGGTGGGIYASGLMQAHTIANVNGRIELTSMGGPVMVGAPGILSDASNPYTSGSIDVSGGAGETGGSVLIQGNGVLLVNDDPTPANPTGSFSIGSSIDASGAAGGGQVDIQSRTTVGLLGLSRINADSQAGLAGQVRVVAVNDVLGLGDISASSKNGDGGSVGVGSSTGNVLLMGAMNAVGGNNGGVVSLLAANGVLAIDGYVGAGGYGGNGGRVMGIANNVVLTENSQVSADGDLGVGGQVGFHANNSLAAYGLLTARGNTAGGRIITAMQGNFDVRGLVVDAGSNGSAGSWLLDAPSLMVVNGSDVGSATTPVLGNSVQDAEINHAFEAGTSVVLQSGGDVQFDDAQVLAQYSSPLSLHVNATGAIYGSGFSIGSSGGALDILFNADSAGGNDSGGYIDFSSASLASNGGLIAMYGQSDQVAGFASGYGNGIGLVDVDIDSAGGDVSLSGHSAGGRSGAGFAGVHLDNSGIHSGGGKVELRGRGLGTDSDGLLLGSGTSIVTNGGGIDFSGEGGNGAGISMRSGSTVDAGNSQVVLRAGNDGSSDAIRLQGAIRSSAGVNLRPGGVDSGGGLADRVDDEILLGGGTTGFALSAAELAMVESPELIIGSSLHAGSIHVLGAISRDGNLTLQNDGGPGGIDIQAALDLGGGTLALSSGGTIIQASAGAISAHSLLAKAAGDVLLGSAQNNVAATTLAGSAGGAFEFQDQDALAIGNVSATGFDASSGVLSSLGANGIDAGGDVLVRNLAGDMILNGDVRGANIDLVTAGRLQNPGGASLVASGNWHVWANTWEGETRGGLAGNGGLPNLYGCAYLGACGVAVPAADNHFIYVQQPTALISFADFSREYATENPVFTFTVTGAILGDTAANVAAGGTASTTATITSDVGLYPITGVFASAAGYRIQLVPGTLSVTPAMLFFTADPALRYFGTANPKFTGTVTGFRNGDSVESVFGTTDIWSSPADFLSPVGFHPINGGASAKNYAFNQAPGNATALQIIPLPQLSSTPIDLVRETVNSYVYDRNFGGAPVCALNTSLSDEKIASAGDELSIEWSKVRSRPNLTNCFDSERKDGCSSF